jgi:hypothetical protein
MRAAVFVAAAAVAAAHIPAAPAAGIDLLPDAPGAERTVKLFDLLCMTLVPDLAAIGRIASAEFEEITGAALDRYRPEVAPAELRAWRFGEFGAEYALVVTRSAPNKAFREAEPEFADSTSYDCTLVLPAVTPQGEIRAAMAALMAREPDDVFEAGKIAAARWDGRTEAMLVNVLHYGPASGAPGGGLKSVAFVLPPHSAGKSDSQ